MERFGCANGTSQLRVAMRLVTVIAGAAPAGNCAHTMDAFAFCTRRALPALQSMDVERVRWSEVRSGRVIGSQMRVGPWSGRSRPEVVTSYVRQSSGAGPDTPHGLRGKLEPAAIA